MRQPWGTHPKAGVHHSECVMTVHMAGLNTRDQLHAAVLLQPLKGSWKYQSYLQLATRSTQHPSADHEMCFLPPSTSANQASVALLTWKPRLDTLNTFTVLLHYYTLFYFHNFAMKQDDNWSNCIVLIQTEPTTAFIAAPGLTLLEGGHKVLWHPLPNFKARAWVWSQRASNQVDGSKRLEKQLNNRHQDPLHARVYFMPFALTLHIIGLHL